MGKNEKTSKDIASIAGRVLASDKYSADIKALAASCLTQAPDKKPSRSKK